MIVLLLSLIALQPQMLFITKHFVMYDDERKNLTIIVSVKKCCRNNSIVYLVVFPKKNYFRI